MSEVPSVRLRVGDAEYSGFIRGEVRLSLEELAPTFQLEYYDDEALEVEASARIVAGDRCQLLVDDEVLIDGYVDDDDFEVSDKSIRLGVSGRAVTADLVDCSARHARGQWRDADIRTIAADICRPFGISVEVSRPGAKFRRFSIQKGETAIEAIVRAARLRGLIPTTSASGLALVRAGEARTETILRRGENIFNLRRSRSWKQRYSEYRFRGQTHATDELSGRAAAQLHHRVTDPAITRYRPLDITSSGEDGTGDLGEVAVLERNRRAGKGERIQAGVVGWKTAERRLWRPNLIARTVDPWARVDADLIVAGVTYSFGPDESSGHHTTLELTRPEAFDQVDYPALGRGAEWT